MFDQEFCPSSPSEENFRTIEEIYQNIKSKNVIKLYSKEEKLRDFIEGLQNESKLINAENELKDKFKEISVNSEVRQKLLEISTELLNFSRSKVGQATTLAEIKDLDSSYKSVMEKFLDQLEKFLDSVQELRKELHKTVTEFHRISRWTARITLASSATEIVLLFSNVLQKLFDVNDTHFQLKLPSLPTIATIVGGVSITASVFALSYMKNSTADISRHVRHENHIFMDLIILLKRGNWIDREILGLFPHGINLKLIDTELKNRNIFQDKMVWRQHLCSTILLTNIQKDPKLLKDEKFLQRVKLFVESQTAEIWWCRIKLRKLLDGMLQKMDAISSKKFVADHAVHYNRTAVYLYSILIPWLLNSWHSTGLRVIFSSIAAILAVSDLANNECEEFEELKKISQNFEKDFQEIIAIFEALENDYD